MQAGWWTTSSVVSPGTGNDTPSPYTLILIHPEPNPLHCPALGYNVDYVRTGADRERSVNHTESKLSVSGVSN